MVTLQRINETFGEQKIASGEDCRSSFRPADQAEIYIQKSGAKKQQARRNDKDFSEWIK